MTISEFPAKFGKYILLDRLNAGGMAEVFRAKVTGVEGFERLVAIKCMLPALLNDEQFSNMFIDEARLAAQVGHANVAQIYELGRQAERLYIAMELIHGRDLRHVIKTANAMGRQLPPEFAAYVCSKAAEGLDFAHRKAAADGKPLGLVHRDISPQNILISYDGEVKVVDFGIAKANSAARDTQTQVGVLKGKFAYMSPEQVLGQDIDRRADIFALGSVLYELVTGNRLFTGESDLTVLERVRGGVLPDLNIVLPQNATDLIPVFEKALHVEPEQRFGWASEMAEALEPMLMGERNIFGPKRAAALMREMYAAEVIDLAEKLKKFAAINESNCISVIGEDNTDPGRGRMVFESTFARGPARARKDDDDTGVVPRERLASPEPAPRAAPVRAVQQKIVVPKPQARPDVPAAAKTEILRPVAPEPTYVPSGRERPTPAVATQVAAARPSVASLQTPAAVTSGSGAQVRPPPAASEARKPRRTARTVMRRLQVVMTVAIAVMGSLVFIVNASLPTPMTLDGAFDQLKEVHPISFAQGTVEQLRNSRTLDRWLFGSTRAELPVVQSSSRFNPSNEHETAAAAGDAPEGGSVPNDTEGFLQITVLGAESAHVSVDEQDFGLAPTPPMRLRIGTHTIRVERQRSNGTLEHRESRVRVGVRNTQAEPLSVTLAF